MESSRNSLQGETTLAIILEGSCGEIERGNVGFVSANLTSELAASSSQNSLPGGSSDSQPVVCGDLGPLLVLLRNHCQAQQCEPAQFFLNSLQAAV